MKRRPKMIERKAILRGRCTNKLRVNKGKKFFTD